MEGTGSSPGTSQTLACRCLLDRAHSQGSVLETGKISEGYEICCDLMLLHSSGFALCKSYKKGKGGGTGDKEKEEGAGQWSKATLPGKGQLCATYS